MKDTGILLINCPDRKGLVAAVANFLYQNGANVVHSDQHEDNSRNRFLMRIEWELAGCKLDFDGFRTEFAKVATPLNMNWRMERSSIPTRLAIFASKHDHCLADLLYRNTHQELGCEVVCIISNHADAERLAEFYKIPFYHVPTTSETSAEGESRQLEILAEKRVDLIALARYMRILSVDFLTRFGKPIINVHHSFLPAFSGAKPYQRAFERGVKLIGATSHYVTEVLDEGPIIEQGVVQVSHRDQLDDIVRKGRDLERSVLSTAVSWHAHHRILVDAGKTIIFD